MNSSNFPLISSIEAAIMAFQQKRKYMHGDPFELLSEILRIIDKVENNPDFEREFIQCSQGRRKLFMDIFIRYLEDIQACIEAQQRSFSNSACNKCASQKGDFISENAFRLIEVLCNNSSLFCGYIPHFSERALLSLYQKCLKERQGLMIEMAQRILRVKAQEIVIKTRNHDPHDFDMLVSELNTQMEVMNTFGIDYQKNNLQVMIESLEKCLDSLRNWMDLLNSFHVVLNGEALYEVIEFREKLLRSPIPEIAEYFRLKFEWLKKWLDPPIPNAKVISDRMAFRRNYVCYLEALHSLKIAVFYHQFQPALLLLKQLVSYYENDRDLWSSNSLFMYENEYHRLQQEGGKIILHILKRIWGSREFLESSEGAPLGRKFLMEFEAFLDFVLRCPQIRRWEKYWLKIYEDYRKPRYWT